MTLIVSFLARRHGRNPAARLAALAGAAPVTFAEGAGQGGGGQRAHGAGTARQSTLG